jgi:hypothetical protein
MKKVIEQARQSAERCDAIAFADLTIEFKIKARNYSEQAGLNTSMATMYGTYWNFELLLDF